jgi:hypothetical protein
MTAEEITHSILKKEKLFASYKIDTLKPRIIQFLPVSMSGSDILFCLGINNNRGLEEIPIDRIHNNRNGAIFQLIAELTEATNQLRNLLD